MLDIFAEPQRASDHKGVRRIHLWPDLIKPDLIEPDLIEPDLIEPDLIEPDLIEPDLIKPGVIEPGVRLPAVLAGHAAMLCAIALAVSAPVLYGLVTSGARTQ
ncbi:MAG: hypothetical protein H7279_10465 [Microbacteriaceae bacterium]|nr:hypothetical protein [Microbacteriaceae bacterium]